MSRRQKNKTILYKTFVSKPSFFCSPAFDDFLSIIGDKVRLKGFDRYKGGLDTVHDLTGLHSVFTHWRGIEIMFHVSTMLPHEPNDPQKVGFLEFQSEFIQRDVPVNNVDSTSVT